MGVWILDPNLLRALRDLLFLAWPEFLRAVRSENQGLVEGDLFNRGLCLPSGSNLTEGDLARVVEVVRACMR